MNNDANMRDKNLQKFSAIYSSKIRCGFSELQQFIRINLCLMSLY